MTIGEQQSYYDILDLKPDASPQEVREAYLRTKGTYNKDSVALYTLVSTEEREDMLRRIEEAYEILSNADRRREYDQHHGLLEGEPPPPPVRRPIDKKIVSIDRVPPMDTELGGEDLLIAPATDFTSGPAADRGLFSSSDAPLPSSSHGQGHGHDAGRLQPAHPPVMSQRGTASHDPGGASEIQLEIAQQIEWAGKFIRKVRETKRVSIEEMAAVTKITKNYIVAIEEENFPKLPAAVYLRGFIIQIAKVLKLPHEKVAGGYMARYYQARPDQNH
jgi:curved DNA-binding protein CbpA